MLSYLKRGHFVQFGYHSSDLFLNNIVKGLNTTKNQTLSVRPYCGLWIGQIYKHILEEDFSETNQY